MASLHGRVTVTKVPLCFGFPSGGSAVPRFQIFVSSHAGPRWVLTQRTLDFPASSSRVRPVRSTARSSISRLSYAGVVSLLRVDSSALTSIASQFSLLFIVLHWFSTRFECAAWFQLMSLVEQSVPGLILELSDQKDRVFLVLIALT
jgi:hypothetical protein